MFSFYFAGILIYGSLYKAHISDKEIHKYIVLYTSFDL